MNPAGVAAVPRPRRIRWPSSTATSMTRSRPSNALYPTSSRAHAMGSSAGRHHGGPRHVHAVNARGEKPRQPSTDRAVPSGDHRTHVRSFGGTTPGVHGLSGASGRHSCRRRPAEDSGNRGDDGAVVFASSNGHDAHAAESESLESAASERLATIAPAAISAPYAPPIDSPPPSPRTPPPAHAEVVPPVTVAPPPAVVPPEPAVVRNDTDDVRAVLGRYQTAFSHLDASQAKAIWPSVDEKALGRAFGQLERQEVVLQGCDVMVAGQRAAAACRGQSSYVPRVGNKAARVEARRWAFTLRKIGESWIIEAVDLASR